MTLNNLSMIRGKYKAWTCSVRQGPQETDPVFDLSQSKVRFTMKAHFQDTKIVVQKNSETNGGITIIDASQGTFRLEIMAADTEDLPSQNTKYVYEIDVIDGKGPRVAGRGIVEILASVTIN